MGSSHEPDLQHHQKLLQSIGNDVQCPASLPFPFPGRMLVGSSQTALPLQCLKGSQYNPLGYTGLEKMCSQTTMLFHN